MAGENVERVRGWHDALNSDRGDVAAVVDDFWEPDGDYYPVRKFPEASPRHGRAEIADFITGFMDAFSVSWLAQEVVDVGGDRVLGRTNLRAEGIGSGVELAGDVYHCYWLRHGRFFRVEDHLTVKGALRAFGFDAETLEDAGLDASTT